MPIKAPYLPYEQLHKVAESFLTEHNPGRSVPVPIDEIVDLGFGMDVVPIPGIREVLDIDAWISNDLSTIYVDEFVYYKRPNRYRFSLAHELSHRLIHGDIYRQLKFRNISEWKEVINAIPRDQYGWLEWQAYCLAGLILVPPRELEAAYEEADSSAWAAGVSLKDADEASQKPVFAHIGATFGVSWEVIKKRLHKDGITGR
jgi:hypothetical protein